MSLVTNYNISSFISKPTCKSCREDVNKINLIIIRQDQTSSPKIRKKAHWSKGQIRQDSSNNTAVTDFIWRSKLSQVEFRSFCNLRWCVVKHCIDCYFHWQTDVLFFLDSSLLFAWERQLKDDGCYTKKYLRRLRKPDQGHDLTYGQNIFSRHRFIRILTDKKIS